MYVVFFFGKFTAFEHRYYRLLLHDNEPQKLKAFVDYLKGFLMMYVISVDNLAVPLTNMSTVLDTT
jgi:hypothetical protein